MEHNTNILSSSVLTAPLTKNQGSSELLQVQAEGISTQFAEIMQNALLTAHTGLSQMDEQGQDNPLLGLQQQIMDLSAKTEGLLLNADPEVVEDILSQAVTQLWKLVENFDVQNGTQYVLELSENLTEAVPESLTKTLSGILPEAVPKNFTETVPESLTEAVPESLTETLSGNLTETAQDPEIEEALLPGAFIQPVNQLVAGKMVSEVPAPTGREEIRSLISSHIKPQTGDAPLFAYVSNLLSKPQSLARNGQIPVANSTTTVQVSVLEPVEFIARAVSDLPQQIQQFTVPAPVKKQTHASNFAGQVAGELANAAGKINVVPVRFVGNVDVKTKVKELLLMSARAIVSNVDASILPDENGGLLFQAKPELLNVHSAAQPDHVRTARNFSQNLAGQIQGKILNEGLTRIELAPRGLGNIIIEMHTKQTGDIQIIVKAENPTVLFALRSDRETLLSVLSNNGLSQDSIELEFEEFSEGQFNREEAEISADRGRAQVEVENEDAEDTVNNSSATQRPLGIGQIDILT